jgi:hypothetical protein
MTLFAGAEATFPVAWPPDTYRADEAPSRHEERALSVQAARLGGAEIRPTRMFVWAGDRLYGREWIVSLGPKPRLLQVARRRRHLELLGCQISYLGNPAVTVTLFLAQGMRRLVSGSR